ncbi:hypothetical protein [Nitrospirillum sp. BR 11163]|uniref:hypothetical protein n=1 Tax=Nitrospirillum sp. BR 11163 TaxID=3104323 RepID=UPI002AFE101E|nr:hypothetical protein [Nitrospirillum sp. BR 11163]MEA1674122.1 hypothetical protein [Nitrospirillum sp. BR 11163]
MLTNAASLPEIHAQLRLSERLAYGLPDGVCVGRRVQPPLIVRMARIRLRQLHWRMVATPSPDVAALLLKVRVFLNDWQQGEGPWTDALADSIQADLDRMAEGLAIADGARTVPSP